MERILFNDNWKMVTLPHDAMTGQNREAAGAGKKVMLFEERFKKGGR